MMRIIRWPGVVGFFVLVVVVIVFFALFLDNLVRAGLSSALTRTNRAEVNIEQVELRWSPFAVDIKNLQMTNPEKPTHNRFAANSLRAEVRFWELLIGKIHVEELTATGVQIDHERAQPGKVLAAAEPREKIAVRDRLAEFNIELPTAKSFLEGANIATPALVKEAEEKFNQREQLFSEARKNLPKQEALDNYQARIEAIIDSKPRTPRDLLAAREELNNIKQELRAEKERVDAFLAVSESIVKDTKQDIDEVKATYQADLDRARALFSFDTESLTELSGIMFGAQVEQWAGYALMAFDLIAPLLENAKENEATTPSRWQGRYVDFDTHSSPTLWVKQAQLSMQLEELEFGLAMQNITWQHERINTPTEFQLTTNNAPGWEQFNFNGDLFINNLGQVRGKQQWQLAGVQLHDLELIGSSSLSTAITTALLNSVGSLVINNGDITGQGDLHFTDTDFSVTGEGRVPQYFGQALSRVNTFELNLGLSGRFSSPKFQLRSDLDQQLGTQLNAILSTEVESRLAEVRTSLTSDSNGFMSKAEPWLVQAEALHGQGKSLEEGFAELLKAEVDNLIESESERLLDRLKKKLGNN
ncbi:TIGR03545 family protein [Aliidiomarina quisquiliarum]|uniref:TIGR03545 family protein n=1 Tax=Aliidiomarina quisquiliarum TaxID=2938947 RepID=UPI00208F2BAE|nr:TIGR03545 family protein [Aliidiomarina quisquiliarum]MCO4322677.1 TIGR03545 family protein [Aliidiomarina quisquiliarum]